MESLRFAFFYLKLVSFNAVFLVKLGWALFPLSAAFLAAVGLWMVHVAAIISHTHRQQLWLQTLQSYLAEITNYQLVQQQQKLTSTHQQLKTFPTHRDLLLEAAILSCQLQQIEACTLYLDQATYVDPNHPNTQAVRAQLTPLLD